ncbi:MAG: acetylxylan esterase [Dysgonamonadaceae bacterium]|jgi:cephalosporin-C deacetylase-like acetyl esterase|nr:acetylxylan esterase [Dysgonamonadaceae bacterium]
MKRKFLFACSLFCLLATGVSIQAQPAQKLVNILVSPDHADWKYGLKETAVFKIQVIKDNVLMKDVSVDYELGPECFPTEIKKGVILKNGELTLKASMNAPGFLRCKVSAEINGVKYEEMATAGYDVDNIRPTTADPKDFDAFWTASIATARQTPLDAKFLLLPQKCTSTMNCYEVSFQNERSGSRIYGILLTPKKPGKYPAVLRVPGAGVRPYSGYALSDSIITLDIGIHGISVTQVPELYVNLSLGALNRYPHFNLNDRNKHYYKRVYTGCVRAVDFIYSLPEFDGETIGLTGGSQGGALSIITAALDTRIDFLAANYPALCDYAGYLNHRAGGWPHYFKDAKPNAGEVETLACFDVVNFARRLKAKGLYSWGFNDLVCPPTSMHAAYNVIPAEKELKLYLNTGHWTYPEENAAFSEWLKKQCNYITH